MKRTFLCLLLSIGAASVFGQSAVPDSIYENLPFEMSVVWRPVFLETNRSIVEFGAVPGGETLNTSAINRAIAEVSASGGGRVTIPRGLWLTGPVVLANDIDLHLESGAVLMFSRNMDDYPLVKSSFEGNDSWRCQSPISGRDLVNVAITGEGIIDGNGDAWRYVKRGKMTDGQWKNLVASGGVLNPAGNEWYPSENSLRGSREISKIEMSKATPRELMAIKDYLRPVMVSLVGCRNVMLDGVTFQNSPAWNLHPLMCENVILSNLTVRNPWYSQNGDGLDVESCRNVVVYKCSFDVGDDAICIKSGKDEQGRKRGIPTENLIVDQCLVYHAHGGFVVGSEMSGGVRNVRVTNCTFLGTDVGLRFKSNRGRGGVVENIWISDINMTNIPAEALLFDLYYGGMSAVEELEQGIKKGESTVVPAVDETTPQFRNIFIKNVTCNGANRAMLFNGLPEKHIENVTLDNINITSTYGAKISATNNLRMTNIKITPQKGEPFEVKNSAGVTLDGKGFRLF